MATWKKPGTSDIEIVCAGRPLLEWCVRRRLDDEPRIGYRYESEVADLVYDRENNAVIGVAVDRDGETEVVPAEFVVDASGKNTRVPEFLERNGIGAPEVEQDIINCFYSTMQHRVPPERQWQDKVMVICYAYRPYEDTYAAQYYTDSSRTILSTSLVAYNCYSPPRTAAEFREFADQMPSSVVGENIDGLEPASPIYNFRYPNMMRLRYEKKRNLPRALVAVGDAYTSADPVSGLGMTLALKEVRELQLLLAQVRSRASGSAAPLLPQDRQDGRHRLVRHPRAEPALRLDQGCGRQAAVLLRRADLVHGPGHGAGSRRSGRLPRVPGRRPPGQAAVGPDDAQGGGQGASASGRGPDCPATRR